MKLQDVTAQLKESAKNLNGDFYFIVERTATAEGDTTPGGRVRDRDVWNLTGPLSKEQGTLLAVDEQTSEGVESRAPVAARVRDRDVWNLTGSEATGASGAE